MSDKHLAAYHLVCNMKGATDGRQQNVFIDSLRPMPQLRQGFWPRLWRRLASADIETVRQRAYYEGRFDVLMVVRKAWESYQQTWGIED